MKPPLILDQFFPSQPPENEDDNREYKRHLVPQKKNEKYFYHKRATQMQYRLHLGNGKALYIIGIEDNGNNKGVTEKELNISLENINLITEIINANVKNIRIYNGLLGKIATVRIEIENNNKLVIF
jgi:elongation factor 1-alpha